MSPKLDPKRAHAPQQLVNPRQYGGEADNSARGVEGGKQTKRGRGIADVLTNGMKILTRLL